MLTKDPEGANTSIASPVSAALRYDCLTLAEGCGPSAAMERSGPVACSSHGLGTDAEAAAENPCDRRRRRRLVAPTREWVTMCGHGGVLLICLAAALCVLNLICTMTGHPLPPTVISVGARWCVLSGGALTAAGITCSALASDPRTRPRPRRSPSAADQRSGSRSAAGPRRARF